MSSVASQLQVARGHEEIKKGSEDEENTEDEVFEIRKESNNPLAYKDTDTKLECNKCDATFSTLRCKKQHEMKATTGKYHRCTSGNCFFKSCTMMGLVKHRKKYHMDSFKFECDIFNNRFSRKHEFEKDPFLRDTLFDPAILQISQAR